MHDDHRDIHRLGDAQEPGHGLRLQEIGPGPGMGADAHLPRGLLLGDQRVNDTAVFAVHAADASLFLQLLQGVIHGLVADHHGGIGHIHLERGDTGGVHIVDLRLDAGVPVVDGHMEAVVTAAVAVGLPVPKLQPLVQSLALVGAGEVHHRGGAAPQSRPAAGEKVVRRGGAAHVQVEVGVGVDEARQQKLPLHVDDGGLRRGDAAGHPEDLLVLHQHVRPAGPPSGHHRAPAKQIFHGNALLFRIIWLDFLLYHGTGRKTYCFSRFFPEKIQQKRGNIFVYLAEGKRISFSGKIMYDRSTTERILRSENEGGKIPCGNS